MTEKYTQQSVPGSNSGLNDNVINSKVASSLSEPTVALMMLAVFSFGLWCGVNYKKNTETPTVPPHTELVSDVAFKKNGVNLLGDDTIAQIAANAAPAVVNIELIPKRNPKEARSRMSLKRPEFLPGFPHLPYFPRHRFRHHSQGSGVVIRPDGYILTNSHVIRAGNEIHVTLNDKREFNGVAVGKDPFTDLAVIKINANNLAIAPLGISKRIRPGDWAIAIGSPLGYDHTVTLGIISAIGRSLADLNSHVELIQTDAAINFGNSGGPLLNIKGEVIGINTAIRSDGQNIGFAVPTDVARDVANNLMAHGDIVRPYLGVYMHDLPSEAARALNISSGVVIGGIVPGGPSEKSGLGPGDLIKQVDGSEVKTSKQVREIISKHKPGDVIDLVVVRRNMLEPRKVTVGAYPTDTELR